MKKLKPHQLFSTHLFETDGHPFDVSGWKLIKSIHADASFIKRNAVQIVADPFLFVHNDCLFVFYENLISVNNGTIEMTQTKDMINWSKPITVLKCNTHLSYPFIFRDAGNIFMIPETYQGKNVQLFKANPDLTEWSFEKEILNGDEYVDSSIFLHDHVYYLFTTVIRENYDYELQLYFSNDLYGEFVKHPKSPIAIGHSVGRSGGAIFKVENKIFRPAQICEKYYGESLSIYRIKVLTTNDYQEEIEIDRFLSKPMIPAGHHFHFAKFNNKLIIAIDEVGFTFNFWVFWYTMLKRMNCK